MRQKKPWLAAVLNFVFPGLGYIYLGKRKVFAVILIAAILLAGINRYFLNASNISPYSTMAVIISIMISSAFAYDAFNEAKSK